MKTQGGEQTWDSALPGPWFLLLVMFSLTRWALTTRAKQVVSALLALSDGILTINS